MNWTSLLAAGILAAGLSTYTPPRAAPKEPPLAQATDMQLVEQLLEACFRWYAAQARAENYHLTVQETAAVLAPSYAEFRVLIDAMAPRENVPLQVIRKHLDEGLLLRSFDEIRQSCRLARAYKPGEVGPVHRTPAVEVNSTKR